MSIVRNIILATALLGFATASSAASLYNATNQKKPRDWTSVYIKDGQLNRGDWSGIYSGDNELNRGDWTGIYSENGELNRGADATDKR